MTATTDLDSTVASLALIVAAAEPTLTALDQATGDGDFGSNLDEGLRRVQELIAVGGAPWRSLQDVFLDEVGGTSGPLFGLLFQALGRAAHDSSDYPTAVASGLIDGLAAIQRVGEAAVGDRTLVDALEPATQSLLAAPCDFTRMVSAAVDGALATANIQARRGRSSYVGERAIGHPDPGAVGTALLLSVLAEPITGADVATSARCRLLQG